MNEKTLSFLEKKYSVDKEKAAFILGKVKMVKKVWDNFYTDFLTLNEQEFLKAASFEEDVFVSFQGEDEFERKMAVISPVECTGDFPIGVVKLTGNFKFEKLTHRDYLGSVLGLGIKREKIGDINVYEDGAEILVHKDILEYIVFNLKKVKHTGVKPVEISLEDVRKKSLNLEERKINVSSLRFDAVISGVFNISRGKSSDLIKSGNAKVNNIVVEDTSEVIKESSVITLRGYGKAKVGEMLSTTKKVDR